MLRNALVAVALPALLLCVPAAAAERDAAGDQVKLGERLVNRSCVVCHFAPQITSGSYAPALSKETLGRNVEIMHQFIWFNCNVGRGALCRLDPKTQKIETFLPPEGMSPTGGATTVDWDGKGKIWVSAPDGVLRFDPVTEKFTAFKSPTFNTPNGKGTTYGAAGDRDGDGWWAEMIIDTVDQGVSATGQSVALKLPPVALPEDAMSDADRKFYASFFEPDFNAPVPWNEGPRRMGSDKNGDVLWVGDSWGRNLAKIDIHTHATSFVPLPGPGVMQPYHIAVDSHHDAWLNIWTSDVIMRYDPAADKWTTFDLPTRGTEARYISLLEKDGKMEVVVPYSRTSKIAVMTFRSEADLAALKQQAGQ